MSAVALVAALAVGVRAQDCGTTSVWHPPLTEVRYYPAVTIRHEAVYRHHPAVIVTHPAVVVNHPEVVVNHPAVVVHHDAVVVNHPAVTETHYDEDGNPYEVEISPAWDEEIAPAWDEEVAPAWDEVVEPAWDEVISPAWDEEVSPAWDELVTPERDEVITPQREEIVEISPGWWEEVPNPCTWTESSTTHGEWGPDPATVPMGQAFNQSRLVTTTTRTLNRNAAGVVTESGLTSATTTETRPATGTGTGGGGSTGGGTSGSGGSGGASQHSIAGPPAPGGTRSFWRDVNGDGLPDEIISAHDPRVGLVLTVEDTGWEDDVSTSWTLEPFRDGGLVLHTQFSWSFENLIVPPSNDPWATVDIIFAPEPGADYVVWTDDVYGYGNNMALWPTATINSLRRYTAADILAGGATVTVQSQRTLLSALSRMTWYVIRLSKISDFVVPVAHSDGVFEVGSFQFARDTTLVAPNPRRLDNVPEWAIWVGTGVGIFVEPVDWVITAIEIYRDPSNPWSYIGIIPGVPGAAGILLKKTGQVATTLVRLLPGGIKLEKGTAAWGLEHIIRGHHASTTIPNKSKFLPSMGQKEIVDLIEEGLQKNGSWVDDVSDPARPKRIYTVDMGRLIGHDQNGNPVSRLLIVVDNGVNPNSITTAYPIQ